MNFFNCTQVGETIGNPIPMSDSGEVATDEGAAPAAPAPSKPAPFAANNNNNKPSGGYQSNNYAQQPEVVTHPIMSLTPYQNK